MHPQIVSLRCTLPSDPLLGLVHRLLPFHDNREIIEISTA
jgi:hypothetical protein